MALVARSSCEEVRVGGWIKGGTGQMASRQQLEGVVPHARVFVPKPPHVIKEQQVVLQNPRMALGPLRLKIIYSRT